MVVPYCYQCAPAAQPAILTIANAYTARLFRKRGYPDCPEYASPAVHSPLAGSPPCW